MLLSHYVIKLKVELKKTIGTCYEIIKKNNNF